GRWRAPGDPPRPRRNARCRPPGRAPRRRQRRGRRCRGGPTRRAWPVRETVARSDAVLQPATTTAPRPPGPRWRGDEGERAYPASCSRAHVRQRPSPDIREEPVTRAPGEETSTCFDEGASAQTRGACTHPRCYTCLSIRITRVTS